MILPESGRSKAGDQWCNIRRGRAKLCSDFHVALWIHVRSQWLIDLLYNLVVLSAIARMPVSLTRTHLNLELAARIPDMQ